MEAVLAVLFMGVCWWLWAKNEKSKRDEERRRNEEDRIIAEHRRGLTNEEIAKMLGVGTERVRKLVDYWRFVNDEPLMTPAQIAEAQKLARE